MTDQANKPIIDSVYTRGSSKRQAVLIVSSVVLTLIIALGVFVFFFHVQSPQKTSRFQDFHTYVKTAIEKSVKSSREKAGLGDIDIVMLKSQSARDDRAQVSSVFRGDDPIMMKITFNAPKAKQILLADIYRVTGSGPVRYRSVRVPAYQQGDRFVLITKSASTMPKGQYVVKFIVSDIPLFEKSFTVE